MQVVYHLLISRYAEGLSTVEMNNYATAMMHLQFLCTCSFCAYSFFCCCFVPAAAEREQEGEKPKTMAKNSKTCNCQISHGVG